MNVQRPVVEMSDEIEGVRPAPESVGGIDPDRVDLAVDAVGELPDLVVVAVEMRSFVPDRVKLGVVREPHFVSEDGVLRHLAVEVHSNVPDSRHALSFSAIAAGSCVFHYEMKTKATIMTSGFISFTNLLVKVRRSNIKK